MRVVALKGRNIGDAFRNQPIAQSLFIETLHVAFGQISRPFRAWDSYRIESQGCALGYHISPFQGWIANCLCAYISLYPSFQEI
jgi:hypothetical protein